MAMSDEVIINSIDVTDSRIAWVVDKEWKVAIDSAVIELAPSVRDIIVPVSGQTVTIKRGWTTATDKFLFEGQITQIKPQATKIICICKGRLYDAVKEGQTKSWDKDIDTAGGVGSEIFKDLCDHSQLEYDSSSIISTGTDTPSKIVKLVQNDEDDFQIMNQLAEFYSYTIDFDYDNTLTRFRPQGYTVYSHVLVVGTDIPGQIKWKENMEQLINKVKILGATVYDKIVDTAAGPTTTINLSKTPEDTELRYNHASTDTLLVRGVKDVGIFGTDYDYYIEEDQKKITLATNRSDLWVRYGAQIPMPVVLRNQTSIDTYGGPKKIPSFKRFTFNNLKDVKDVEDKGYSILNKYSTPFITAEDVPVTDSTLETYGIIEPGMLVTIADTEFNDRTDNVFVQSVKYSWPHKYDKITVGDEIWRTENWQVAQMEKINKLFSELNKNEDILISTFDFPKNLTITRDSFERIRYKICDSWIAGHWVNGLVGMGTALDDFKGSSATNWNGTNFVLTDSTDQSLVGSYSMKCVWSGGVGTGTILSETVIGDLSTYTGIASGTPTKGTIGLWIYLEDSSDITDISLKFGSGPTRYIVCDGKSYSSVDGYGNWDDLTLSLQDGWNYILFDISNPESITGTPIWTSVDYISFDFEFNGNKTIYLDYLTISESNYIGLNGAGVRRMEVD